MRQKFSGLYSCAWALSDSWTGSRATKPAGHRRLGWASVHTQVTAAHLEHQDTMASVSLDDALSQEGAWPLEGGRALESVC